MKSVYLDKDKKHMAKFLPHDRRWAWFTLRKETGIYSSDRKSFDSLGELKAAYKHEMTCNEE